MKNILKKFMFLNPSIKKIEEYFIDQVSFDRHFLLVMYYIIADSINYSLKNVFQVMYAYLKKKKDYVS